jgi:hypothetical protein
VTLSHSASTSAAALTFWAGAAIIIKLMASAAAMSIYIALAGQALSLIIISSFYRYPIYFSLSPEVDPSGLESLETFFFSKPSFKPASFSGCPFRDCFVAALLAMAKDNGSFARARRCSLPLGESLQIATSPSAPRNEEKKAPGNDNSLRDFAISITSFRYFIQCCHSEESRYIGTTKNLCILRVT